MAPPVWLRTLYGGRALYGAVLLLAPRGLLASAARAPVDRNTLVVARVLGARQILQAAILSSRPQPVAQLIGAAVDALHAASMAGLGRWATGRDHRRLARHDARTAGLLALSGVAAAAGCAATRAPAPDLTAH